MLKLLLIRHGESVGNQDQRMSGRLDDDLTSEGVAQCRQLGQWLHQQNWRPSHIYSSPLRRSLLSLNALLTPWSWQLHPSPQTALDATAYRLEQTCMETHCDKATLPQLAVAAPLQESDLGILTGLTWAEAQTLYPALCQALLTSPTWVPIPDAETPAAGYQRAATFIHTLIARHSNHDALWLMSHQWIMQHLIAGIMGSDRTWKMPISNTAIFEFWLDRDRWQTNDRSHRISDFWHIKRFGERPHLYEP